eukprot:gene27174-33857_t
MCAFTVSAELGIAEETVKAHMSGLLAKDWRTDRVLRRLEAMLLVADATSTLVITGNGDVLEPEKGIGAIGSGGTYAQKTPS